MKIIVMLLFVVALATMPVWAFDQLVVTELAGLKRIYGNAEATAQKAVDPTY